MRFDLKKEFPLLTTKKMYFKGVIHELLWFLHGETNIKYLVENKVHIWDDDAYRFYLELVKENNEIVGKYRETHLKIAKMMGLKDDSIKYEQIKPLDEKSFLNEVLLQSKMCFFHYGKDRESYYPKMYVAGDLGPVYGKQWRGFGYNNVDQIQKIIDTLKTNPDDRRMLCVAFNPDMLDQMALPPCHILEFLLIGKGGSYIIRNIDMKNIA